jgi:2,3-bisphosphoglycerate-dependent phosphoglycerate mutase
MACAHKLVLVRHGESEWNAKGLFTGWTDVKLTALGEAEAVEAGELLKKEGYDFDVCFSSVLTRSIATLNIVLEALDRQWLPVTRLWRLNERSYGALQGLNKAETAAKHGEAQVKIWRRAYAIPPPLLETSDARHPVNDRRYGSACYDVPPAELPGTESLKDTVARFMPAWENEIAPALRSGKRVLVAAHGNSIRALVKYLDDVSEDVITELNIPTAVPLVYELDAELRPLRHYYLGDAEAIAAKISAVAAQGTVKKE